MDSRDDMKIVIASDSYKGSLSSKRVGEVVKKGLSTVFDDADISVIPVGDGGEGTVESLVDATRGEYYNLEVTAPLIGKVTASYGISGDGNTAFIEMASASGLNLTPIEKRNPYISTTYGTGEVLKSALDKGVKKIIMGIGGSATNDGGIGLASALGVKFLDSEGRIISNDNKGIEDLDRIDISYIDKRLKNIEIIAACDVDNPLTGRNGASYIYGGQKGADLEMIETMDQNLYRFASIIRRDLGVDIEHVPGAGSAGGLGAGLMAFCGAELKSGIDIVLDFLNFDQKIAGADLVITGEGMFDHQTLMNKAPIGVARRAKAQGIKVVGIAAVFSDKADILLENGFDAIFSVVSKLSNIDEAINNTERNLLTLSKSIARLL
jgi:glycerate kinase